MKYLDTQLQLSRVERPGGETLEPPKDMDEFVPSYSFSSENISLARRHPTGDTRSLSNSTSSVDTHLATCHHDYTGPHKPTSVFLAPSTWSVSFFDSHFRVNDALTKGDLISGEDTLLPVYAMRKINLQTKELNPTPTHGLAGGVMAYMDPMKYPRSCETPPGWVMSLGLYPGCADAMSLKTLRIYMDVLPTVPLGPVGFNLETALLGERKIQRDVFRHVLQYASVRRPLVISLRSQRGDTSDLIFCTALTDLQEFCGSAQPMHLRGFTGSGETVRKWLKFFPNTYFSLYVGEQPMIQPIDVLTAIPKERLLLESAAPVTIEAGTTPLISPAYVGDVGICIAKWLNVDIILLAEVTTANGRRLFKPVQKKQ
ncbi:uncharacterized protein [Procambarus clarkii]|uniref:uncharacterized protein n=1 Tax=Procambarus clarkii TaxID=6728 RepID=UPI003744A97F